MRTLRKRKKIPENISFNEEARQEKCTMSLLTAHEPIENAQQSHAKFSFYFFFFNSSSVALKFQTRITTRNANSGNTHSSPLESLHEINLIYRINLKLHCITLRVCRAKALFKLARLD